MKVRNLLFIGLLTLATTAFSQNAVLRGTVVENGNASEPVAFANIVLQGTTVGATTDFDGLYVLNAKPGTYNVIFSYMGYKTDTLYSVELVAGEEKELNHEMRAESEILGEVTVVEQADRESQTALLINQRKADEILQNMGSQELSRKGASDVAQGLQKVSGISTISSKFIVVRGMGDRYNNALLNGLPVPSTNPDNKMPDLDLFPTSIVRNLQVTKTFSPELYGDFAGGNINIETKTYTDNPVFVIGLGSSFNTITTGQNFVTYKGGKLDYLGIDDGTRNIPASAENKPVYFDPNFNPIAKKAPVGQNFSFRKSNKIIRENGDQVGYLFSASHNVDYGYRDGFIRIYNAQNDSKLDYAMDRYTTSTNSSVLASADYRREGNKFSYTFLYANASTDETMETEGEHFDYPSDIFTRRYTYRENRVLINQLQGSHGLGSNENLKLNWGLGYSKAISEEPDRRQFVFLYDGDVSESERTYTFNAQDRIDNHRFFSELEENEVSGRVDLEWVTKYANEDKTEVEESFTFGLQAKDKSRYFDYRRFVFDLNGFSDYHSEADINNLDQYFQAEDFEQYDEDGYTLMSEENDVSSVNNSVLRIASAFGNYKKQINVRTRFNGGLRLEGSYQNIIFLHQQITGLVVENPLYNLYLLPSLNLRSDLTENTVLKLSGSRTISRPKFKEIAPFEYTEVFAGIKTRGNENLNNGVNYNMDARYEIYPNHGDMISATLFGKYLDDPIETVMKATASGQLQSYANAENAIVAGVELEYIKKFSNFTEHSFLKNFDFTANAAYMYTQTKIKEDLGNAQTNDQRPLQGASPFLANADLTYNLVRKELPTSLTLSYNVFSDRLYAVGVNGIGDQYEQAVNTLNFTLRSELSKRLSLSFKLNNILNPNVEIVQIHESGNNPIVNEYQRGVSGSFGLNFNLN